MRPGTREGRRKHLMPKVVTDWLWFGLFCFILWGSALLVLTAQEESKGAHPGAEPKKEGSNHRLDVYSPPAF